MTTDHPIPEAERTASDRAWDWLMKASIPVLIGVVGWAVVIDRRVTVNEGRLNHIEADRFMGSDAVKMERRILEQITPAWLKEDLTEIKTLLKDMDKRLRDVERTTNK